MLHIGLTILAVIGKILLGLLLLILLLLLLVLFVPLRYRGTFQKQAAEMQAEASVSWLLKAVSVQVFWIEKKLSFEIRLLGIPLFKLLNRIKGRKKKNGDTGRAEEEKISEDKVSEDKSVEETPPEEKASVIIPKEETPPEEKVSVIMPEEETPSEEKTSEDKPSDGELTETTEDKERIDPVKADSSKEERGTPFRKVKQPVTGFFRKVKQSVTGISQKLKDLLSKAETLSDKVKKIQNLLRSKLFTEVFALTKKEVLLILKHIFPRRLRGRVEYGTGDPGTTGEILAAIAVFVPVLPREVAICPDFEETLFNCSLSLTGRIRLIVPLFHGVKLILNKQVRRFIKKIRHKS